ncbi:MULTISPECIES: hypothetical protein [Pseudomonas]|uniref:hypothetical protein n=1 Tax=Pseudomonas TaxID=286 RepID=UPI00054C0757|nr:MULTISPECIES: hypothetical protein [Pseudomonas]KII36855.1 hypothetical protein RY26_07470 [Pseudomonas fluorescens]UST60767.1 hypothetical protein NF672_09575 [Pseudomonas moraviensis]UST71155.1 hypothetical protein NF674_09525 [Pseudomonas moraviensis]
MLEADTAAPSPSSLKNAFKIALMSSALLLTGSLTTSLSGWITSNQTVRLAEKTSCIARLDKQEESLRIKGDNFITSLASLSAYYFYPDPTEQMKAERLEMVSKAGYALSAFGNDRLRIASGSFVSSIVDSVAYTEVENRGREMDRYKKNFENWILSFQAFVKDIEEQREKC